MQYPYFSVTPLTGDYFLVKTKLSSTVLTQNEGIASLLNWRDKCQRASATSLSTTRDASLCQTSSVASDTSRHLNIFDHKMREEETIRNDLSQCVPIVLDTLFSILVDSDDAEMFQNLDNRVFKYLTKCIRLLLGAGDSCGSTPTLRRQNRQSHESENFIADLDMYIDQMFSHSLAYDKLLEILTDMTDNPLLVPHEMQNCMDVLHYLIKFIVRSYMLYAKNKNDQNQQKIFEEKMEKLFKSLTQFMLVKYDLLHNAKSTCLRNVVKSIPEVIKVFGKNKLAELLKEMLVAVACSVHLLEEKILFIRGLIHSEIFQESECHFILLPVISQELGNTLGQCCNTRLEGYQIVSKDTVTKACTETFGDLMDTLYSIRKRHSMMMTGLHGKHNR